MQAVSLQLLFSDLSPKALKAFAPSRPMKDRSRPTSNGSVYVPPHHQLRSVITTSIATSAVSPPPKLSPVTNVDFKNGTSGNDSSTLVKSSTVNNPYPYLFDLHELQQKQQQEELNSQFDSRNGVGSDQLSDRQLELLNQPGASTSDNVGAWKWKLMTLIRDKDKQELVSREKKDRRDYGQIAALASQMGLHSRLYVKVLVVSKTPLPNYRFDLDDKRPQREVMLPPGLEGRVDVYLKEYLSLITKSAEGFQDVFSWSNSNGSIATDEGFSEQPEPLPHNKAAMEKIMQRSLQLYTEQKAWQVQ